MAKKVAAKTATKTAAKKAAKKAPAETATKAGADKKEAFKRTPVKMEAVDLKGKNLLIVESPAKAKTIEKILGKDFVVKSCYGHIRDLEKDDMGIDIKDNYRP